MFNVLEKLRNLLEFIAHGTILLVGSRFVPGIITLTPGTELTDYKLLRISILVLLLEGGYSALNMSREL